MKASVQGSMKAFEFNMKKPEEDRKTYRPKHCEYNNEYEDKSSNIRSD